ncbi:MAG TPA: hypothetical protein VKV33_07685, partial [Streptosporangiaceae bacterium]|nr:hypothetical protein [Streptosporangiaceae bacterium]
VRGTEVAGERDSEGFGHGRFLSGRARAVVPPRPGAGRSSPAAGRSSPAGRGPLFLRGRYRFRIDAARATATSPAFTGADLFL